MPLPSPHIHIYILSQNSKLNKAKTQATVNPGLGANTAYEGIVHLTNTLHALLQDSPTPTPAQLTSAFAAYDAVHRSRANTVVTLSGVVTRYEAQDRWALKLASRWVSPYIPDGRKADLYKMFSEAAPVLAFAADPDEGKVKAKEEAAKANAGGWGFWSYLGY